MMSQLTKKQIVESVPQKGILRAPERFVHLILHGILGTFLVLRDASHPCVLYVLRSIERRPRIR